jgi:hypothetical protein
VKVKELRLEHLGGHSFTLTKKPQFSRLASALAGLPNSHDSANLTKSIDDALDDFAASTFRPSRRLLTPSSNSFNSNYSQKWVTPQVSAPVRAMRTYNCFDRLDDEKLHK